jgi:phage tail-like protein
MPFEAFDGAAGYTYGFEFDGDIVKDVAEITVGKNEVDVTDIKHTLPDGKQVWKKLPGPPKPGEVTLKIHMSQRLKPILDEFEKVAKGDVKGARKGAAIIVMDQGRKPVMRFELENAWVKSIDFGTLKPFESGPSTCTVVLPHEGMKAKPA